MEYFADGYLKYDVIGNKKRMSITDIFVEAAAKAYTDPNPPSDIQLLKEVYEKCITDTARHNEADCKQFFTDLYAELSKEIHGGAWTGPGVKNTLSRVARGDVYACVVSETCSQKFNLALD